MKDFRSLLEQQFAEKFYKHIEAYEDDKIPYTLDLNRKYYLPDFRVSINKYIETKGLFTESERDKMAAVVSQNTEITIVMVFQNKNTVIPELNLTYSEWCDQHNITNFGFQEELEIKMWLLKNKRRNTKWQQNQ